MQELQSKSVQHDPLMWITRCAVTLVPYNRRPDVLHCHSNLVSSAGLDGNLDVRRTVVCFQHVIVRHGLLSFWV